METVMTYGEWKRIYKKRKWRKWKRIKAFLSDLLVWSMPLVFFVAMFIHWIVFGY